MNDRPAARHSARILLVAAVLLVLIAPVVARVSASRGQLASGGGPARVEVVADGQTRD